MPASFHFPVASPIHFDPVQMARIGVAVNKLRRALFAKADRPCGQAADKPKWDQDRRELWLGNLLCKRYRNRAKNQEPILDFFEQAGWPARIEDPLPPSLHGDEMQRLRDTVAQLNNGNPHIFFECDGNGSILWSIPEHHF